MFERRAMLMCTTCPNSTQFRTIGSGELQIVYDSDLFGTRIKFYSDNGDCLSNTVIAVNTNMNVSIINVLQYFGFMY